MRWLRRPGPRCRAGLGAALAWYAGIDRHASAVLAAHFPHVRNLGDLTAVDWAAVPPADLVTAGFPCQDISTAGRGAGITEGTRTGLWNHIAEVLGQLQPHYISLHLPGAGSLAVASHV